MGFISITDIETSTGENISSEDEPRVQWYIDTVCAWIEDYTREKFSPVTDAELRCQADGWGVIEFPQLTDITSVETWDPYLQTYTALTIGDYAYDGIGRLYGFAAYETIRLTVSYGWEVAPEGVCAVAVELVKAGAGLVQGGSLSGLSLYRVGDVEEQYGVTKDGSVTIHTLMAAELHSYHSGAATWRL